MVPQYKGRYDGGMMGILVNSRAFRRIFDPRGIARTGFATLFLILLILIAPHNASAIDYEMHANLL